MASITTMQNRQPETYLVTDMTSDVIKEVFPLMSKKFKNIQVGDMLIGNKGWHSRITEVGSSIKLEKGDPPKINNYEKTWIVISEKNYKRFYTYNNPDIITNDGNLNIYLIGWKENTQTKVRAIYDVLHSIVVVAKDEHEARRRIATSRYCTGDETKEHPTFWTSEEYTSCREIGKANKDLSEGIVCRDFHNG